MQRVEQIAKEEVHSNDDYLQVCGALLAVTRNMYIEVLGPHDTARIFEAVASSFDIQKNFIEMFKRGNKPTIH